MIYMDGHRSHCKLDLMCSNFADVTNTVTVTSKHVKSFKKSCNKHLFHFILLARVHTRKKQILQKVFILLQHLIYFTREGDG